MSSNYKYFVLQCENTGRCWYFEMLLSHARDEDFQDADGEESFAWAIMENEENGVLDACSTQRSIMYSSYEHTPQSFSQACESMRQWYIRNGVSVFSEVKTVDEDQANTPEF